MIEEKGAMVAHTITESQVYDSFSATAVDPTLWSVLELPRADGRPWALQGRG